MCKPMLTRLDLTEFQPRNGGIVDLSFQRRRFQRINIKLTAKLSQRIGPPLDLLLRRQSGGAKRTDGIGHYPATDLRSKRDGAARRRVTKKRHLPRFKAGVGA